MQFHTLITWSIHLSIHSEWGWISQAKVDNRETNYSNAVEVHPRGSKGMNLELDMEQWTDSKSENENIKAICVILLI